MASAKTLDQPAPDPGSRARGPSLRELQEQFQAAILSGDDAVLGIIRDNSRTGRDVLFGVYLNAYVSRLVEVLAHDHDMLHAYLGDEGFADMARAYIAAYPSRTQNVRWIARNLPAFLTATKPFSNYPQIADLANIEIALNNAFDATNGPVIGLAQLAAVDPETWGQLQFSTHPSSHRFDITTNAFEIWRALRAGTEPPEPVTPGERQRLLVWRKGGTPMIRALGPEEAMMWDEAAKGVRFSILCEMAATYDKPDEAATRAAGYLAGWLNSELLSAAKQQPVRTRKPKP